MPMLRFNVACPMYMATCFFTAKKTASYILYMTSCSASYRNQLHQTSKTARAVGIAEM